MAKIVTEKRPIVVHVHSEEKGRYVAEKCAEHGWHYVIGFEPDMPEDISDLEKALNPPEPIKSKKVKPRRATAFGAARHWHFAGGASTPPLTKGMLRAPLEPQHKVPHAKGGA